MPEATKRVISSREMAGPQLFRGWRAWVLGVGVLLAAWCALALVVFALVGVAITVGVVLLLVIPALAIVALVGFLMRREA